MGTASARRVNLFLETGEENYLKQVGLFGFKYGEPLRFRNIGQVKENIRYIKELRKLKKSYPKLRFHGFDIDMRPGTAYLDLDEFMQKKEVIEFAKINDSFSESLKAIEKSKTSKLKKIYLEAGYNTAKKIRNEAVKTILNYDEFLNIFKNFKDSVAFDIKLKEKPFNWNIFDWREERMFELMANVLKNEQPEDKYIFLGHNGHLIKTDKKNSNGKRYTSWNTIGTWITKRFPDKVYAIWNLIGRGEHRGHGCPNAKTCSIQLIPGTLEEMLFDLSPFQAMYFKNSAIIKKNEELIQTVVNGIEPTFGSYGDSADAFYFIPVVTDLKN
jgi:erythromycin esterase-like protein